MIANKCHCCGRTIFFAEKPDVLRSRAFCSVWCAAESGKGRLDAFEDRNDLWFWLTQTGRSGIYVGRLFGVKPALVYKSIRSRQRVYGATRPESTNAV